MKDWKGNSKSVFAQLGASNHSSEERQNEGYYATDPEAAQWLLRIEDIPKDKPIWECAAGARHLADVFENAGYKVIATDIVKRAENVQVEDFLMFRGNNFCFDGSIITNPPYRYAEQFVTHALTNTAPGNKVCMFLRLNFLEGKRRKELFRIFPPIRVWVSSSRIQCAKNADFGKYKGGSASAFAWFVWEVGYQGQTSLKWFN